MAHCSRIRSFQPENKMNLCLELKKHDHVSDGEHRDLLHLEDVVDAFRAFHSGSGMPVWLEWRDFGI